MKRYFYSLLIVLVAAVSCTKEGQNDSEGNGKPVPHTVTVEIADVFKTKDGMEEIMPVLSKERGGLELYTEAVTYAYSCVDEFSMVFKSDIAPDGQILYAAYPAESATYSAAGLTVSLPSEIIWEENGTFESPLYASVGKTASEVDKISLTVPVGLIKVTYAGVPAGYDALVVTSMGSRLSGTFKVEDGALVSGKISSPNVTSIRFDAIATEKDMTFYLPVPTGIFESITFKLTGTGVDERLVAEMKGQVIEKGVIYPLVTQKELSLEFGEIAPESLVFPYCGESRDYPVIANAEWAVTSGNPEIIAVKKDDNTVSVTVPEGKYLGGISSEIKISSANPSIIIAPAVINVTQENNPSLTTPVGDIMYSADGSAKFSIYPKEGDKAEVKKSNITVNGKTKFGTYTFEFAEFNLASGFFHMENWFGGGCNIQLQFGQYNRVYYQDKNNETYKNGTSFSFAGSMPGDLTAVRRIVLKIFPCALEQGEVDGDTNIQVIVDDVQILNQKVGYNPWKDEAVPGLSVVFGITHREGDIIPAHLTIKSFEYTPEY